MAWTKSGWSDLIGTDLSKQSINAAASATGDIDCNGTNPFITVAVKVVVVFGDSPDDGVTVEFFGRDADDADEPDTVAIYSATIEEVTSTEVRATYQINVSALDELEIKLTNNDSTDAVTVWVEYQGAYQ